ncbi:hypothetical protein L3X38_034808 [Prunus dulcis]|uniref:Uncharacterized protein n=1 Tax=Prunus dulcis TaxID=3755 RepID=A0AAD4YY77_PRUDU|nr:hypothetical protein L3X38_034808 [Prunus dulcis]
MGGSTIFGGGGRCGGLSWRSGKWHGGERWWCHHVNRGIVSGMVLAIADLAITAVLPLVFLLPTMHLGMTIFLAGKGLRRDGYEGYKTGMENFLGLVFGEGRGWYEGRDGGKKLNGDGDGDGDGNGNGIPTPIRPIAIRSSTFSSQIYFEGMPTPMSWLNLP